MQIAKCKLQIEEPVFAIDNLQFAICNLQSLPACVCILVSILTSVGCSDSVNKVAVHGKVSYRGEPITSGAVTFFPASGRPTTVPLTEEGEYATELPPGEYRVTVNIGVALPPGWKEGDPIPPQKIQLPRQFTTQSQTPLTATVTEDNQDPIDFALK
jgi:hypothetical protein